MWYLHGVLGTLRSTLKVWLTRLQHAPARSRSPEPRKKQDGAWENTAKAASNLFGGLVAQYGGCSFNPWQMATFYIPGLRWKVARKMSSLALTCRLLVMAWCLRCHVWPAHPLHLPSIAAGLHIKRFQDWLSPVFSCLLKHWLSWKLLVLLGKLFRNWTPGLCPCLPAHCLLLGTNSTEHCSSCPHFALPSCLGKAMHLLP